MHSLRRVAYVTLALALLMTACGSSSKKASNSPATTSTTAAAASSTVAVAHSDEYGDHLVAQNGMSLYLFEKDQGTTTACSAACANTWPGLAADKPTAGSGIDQSKLSTSAQGNKPNQVVYNGHLLYFFAGDQKPGDVNGAKIPSWYPVSPSGDKIDKS